MIEAVVLPKQIIDQLRTERGGIVEFAIREGAIVEKEGVSNESNYSKN
jgi:bifunctional DNA-binding transcriptional regulator/antitoxin component of YhaV-PrlF toxin-antitoxin module